MRGSERAVWPPHPTLSPTVGSPPKAAPIVGERGQNLTAADFSDARTRTGGRKSPCPGDSIHRTGPEGPSSAALIFAPFVCFCSNPKMEQQATTACPTKVSPLGSPRWFPRFCTTQKLRECRSAQTREPPRQAGWRGDYFRPPAWNPSGHSQCWKNLRGIPVFLKIRTGRADETGSDCRLNWLPIGAPTVILDL